MPVKNVAIPEDELKDIEAGRSMKGRISVQRFYCPTCQRNHYGFKGSPCPAKNCTGILEANPIHQHTFFRRMFPDELASDRVEDHKFNLFGKRFKFWRKGTESGTFASLCKKDQPALKDLVPKVDYAAAPFRIGTDDDKNSELTKSGNFRNPWLGLLAQEQLHYEYASAYGEGARHGKMGLNKDLATANQLYIISMHLYLLEPWFKAVDEQQQKLQESLDKYHEAVDSSHDELPALDALQGLENQTRIMFLRNLYVHVLNEVFDLQEHATDQGCAAAFERAGGTAADMTKALADVKLSAASGFNAFSLFEKTRLTEVNKGTTPAAKTYLALRKCAELWLTLDPDKFTPVRNKYPKGLKGLVQEYGIVWTGSKYWKKIKSKANIAKGLTKISVECAGGGGFGNEVESASALEFLEDLDTFAAVFAVGSTVFKTANLYYNMKNLSRWLKAINYLGADLVYVQKTMIDNKPDWWSGTTAIEGAYFETVAEKADELKDMAEKHGDKQKEHAQDYVSFAGKVYEELFSQGQHTVKKRKKAAAIDTVSTAATAAKATLGVLAIAGVIAAGPAAPLALIIVTSLITGVNFAHKNVWRKARQAGSKGRRMFVAETLVNLAMQPEYEGTRRALVALGLFKEPWQVFLCSYSDVYNKTAKRLTVLLSAAKA